MHAGTPGKLCLAAAAVGLSLCAAAAEPSNRIQCLQSQSGKLADLAACGHKGSIAYCLSHIGQEGPYFDAFAALETCFVNAGCTSKEATIESEWTLKRCSISGGGLEELRRRAGPAKRADDDDDSASSSSSSPESSSTTSSAEETSSSQAASSSAASSAASSTASSTAESSPSASSVTTTSSITSASSVSSSKRSDSSASSTASATSSPATTGSTTSLVCTTTTTVSTTSCPTQSTGVSSGKQMSCFPTHAALETCAAGLLCSTDTTTGQPICLKLKNKLDVVGIVIALFFSAAIALAVFSICFCCFRERRQYNRIAKEAEALALTKQAAADRKMAAVGVRTVSAQSDTVPLMHADHNIPPMPPISNQALQGGQAEHNPFADQQYHQ